MTMKSDQIDPIADHLAQTRKQAGRSLFLVAALDAAHVLTAFSTASSDKLTAPTVVGGLILNIALIWVLVWAGKGVMGGARTTAALCIVGFVGFGLLIALSMALANGYDVPIGLSIVQFLLLASVLGSLYSVLRLWVSTIKHNQN